MVEEALTRRMPSARLCSNAMSEHACIILAAQHCALWGIVMPTGRCRQDEPA